MAMISAIFLASLLAAGCDFGGDSRPTLPQKSYHLPERGPSGGREVGER